MITSGQITGFQTWYLMFFDPAPKKSIIEPVLLALNNGGPAAGVRKFYQLKNDHQTEYHFHAYRLYQLGRYLIEKERFEDAIKILNLNAIEYPEFWMTFDGLGDAHFKAGNKEKAIKNYRKSLELNPNNNIAKEVLKKLEENK